MLQAKAKEAGKRYPKLSETTPKEQAGGEIGWSHMEGCEYRAGWLVIKISGCGEPVRNCKHGSDGSKFYLRKWNFVANSEGN